MNESTILSLSGYTLLFSRMKNLFTLRQAGSANNASLFLKFCSSEKILCLKLIILFLIFLNKLSF